MIAWPWKHLAAWKEPALWSAGGLVVFALCLVFTFPYNALQTRLIGELQRATGVTVQAAQWSVGFPLALEWRQITASKSEWPPVQLGAIRAQVGLLSALTGGATLDLAAQIDARSPAAGTLTSTINASSWAFSGPLEVHGTLTQIDLSALARPYVSHGSVSGTFTQHLDHLRPPSATSIGEGTWKLTASDLALDQIPVGNGRILSLTLNQLAIGFVCREQLCTLTDLKADSSEGSLSGEGTITIQMPLQQSQLALSLTVTPGPGFAAKAGSLGLPPLPPGTPITVKVQGTLAQARLAL